MQLRARASKPLPQVELTDALGQVYVFDCYPMGAWADAENAVYAYAEPGDAGWTVHYIGAAALLDQHLRNDPILLSAIEAGATHVLVHVPGRRDEVKFREAHMRLVHEYRPPFNGYALTRFERSKAGRSRQGGAAR